MVTDQLLREIPSKSLAEASASKDDGSVTDKTTLTVNRGLNQLNLE